MNLRITEFYARTDTVPKGHSATWDELVGLLTLHDFRQDKDGPMWSPASFRAGGRRCKADVVSVSCLVLDYDGGETYAQVSPRWNGLCHIAHTTHKSSSKVSRFRVTFPLLRPVPGSEWPEFCKAAHVEIGGGTCDPLTDCCRAYYLPSAPSHRRDIAFGFACDGVALDPSTVRRTPVQVLVASPLEGSRRGPCRRTVQFLRTGYADVGRQRSEALRAAGDLRRAGYERLAIEQRLRRALVELAEQRDPRCPWTDRDVCDIVSYFFSQAVA